MKTERYANWGALHLLQFEVVVTRWPFLQRQLLQPASTGGKPMEQQKWRREKWSGSLLLTLLTSSSRQSLNSLSLCQHFFLVYFSPTVYRANGIACGMKRGGKGWVDKRKIAPEKRTVNNPDKRRNATYTWRRWW